ncbi:Uncharacterised protein [Mycobacteroides abscessus subsp. abscessus]|nr:hypothetical protein A3O00_09425 [Mycobacteroides abscessus]SIG59648.1 Uncharacterised protein [Mycobacteroides abscessus subsp. abscessus]SIH59499.1 Uncharacterised protein [Mycobacteroides abscessus subsp. abscessus]SII91173.1 Uncharacterised protein [Mycobacteroides abscessus subsp. abscessus]SIJ45950.1 Uncharacterised protein [Mycobacteroides abscessus subsp. abscessus]
MNLISKLRDAQNVPEPEPTTVEPDPTPSNTGCGKCAPAPFDRGPRFGGHVAARGRAVPTDNGLRSI